MTKCFCGELVWPLAVLSIWCDGVMHAPDTCYPTDDVVELDPRARSYAAEALSKAGS